MGMTTDLPTVREFGFISGLAVLIAARLTPYLKARPRNVSSLVSTCRKGVGVTVGVAVAVGRGNALGLEAGKVGEEVGV